MLQESGQMLFCNPTKIEDLREGIISSDCIFKIVKEEFKKREMTLG